MDAFEKNKIAGAILSALLLAVAINVFTNAFFERKGTHVVGYDLPSDEAAASGKESATAEPSIPFPLLLAKADPAKGEKALGKCKACHSFEKGGPNRVGPNLYGIISHTMGAAAGFNYSTAFKEKNAEKAVWTFEALDTYLTNPKAYIKGTNMAFAGISKAEERADIIAYLRTLSDSPVPLPAAPSSSPATPSSGSSAPATGAPKTSAPSSQKAPTAAPSSKPSAAPPSSSPATPSSGSPAPATGAPKTSAPSSQKAPTAAPTSTPSAAPPSSSSTTPSSRSAAPAKALGGN